MSDAITTIGHLWETDHPYCMTEGCFYSQGHHHEYDSFAEFLDEWADYDEDMNLVFRWDWHKLDADGIADRKEEGDEDFRDTLKIYFIMQRKGYPTSCYIRVTETDEPAVLKYLTPKARHIALLWEPIWQAGAS